MAMLEAMAMSVPVITTSVGGAPEAIRNGFNGCLVRPGDTQDLVSKIRDLVINDERRVKMGTRARDTVVENFGSDRMVASSAASLVEMSVSHSANGCSDQ